MKLSEIKKHLTAVEQVSFELENGMRVPDHFHITEVGVVEKHFIDCGGTMRNEKVVNFQLWQANDLDHRLAPSKLLNIIGLSEKMLAVGDLEVEVEYQSDTIGKYGIDFNGQKFILTSKYTACLATDACGIPQEKQKVVLSEVHSGSDNSCKAGGGCC